MADVTQWATHAIASAQATVADGVAFVWTESTRVTDGLTQKASKLLPSFIFETKSHPKDSDASDLTAEQMEQLMAQTHDAEYPIMPNAPIIVAAASCQDVLIRWKSVPDVKWPLHGYVLQRFPDLNHTKQWATILETNATDIADHEVRASQHYVYRLQAVSGQARSPFAYQAIILSEATCCTGRSLLGFLPAVFGSVPGAHWLSNEAIQTLVLICACFLAVFGVMRSSVTRMQSTRSRQGRLRRMQKSALAESCLPRSSSYGRSSSSESSTTEPATEPTTMNDHQSSTGSVRFDLAVSASTPTRRQSLGALSEPSSRSSSMSTISADPTTCCHFCRKKFGVFRRRFVCEACQSVSLCRKCAIQAEMEPTNGHAEREIRAQPRIHMICKVCCAQPERYSTASSVRPSFQPLR